MSVCIYMCMWRNQYSVTYRLIDTRLHLIIELCNVKKRNIYLFIGLILSLFWAYMQAGTDLHWNCSLGVLLIIWSTEDIWWDSHMVWAIKWKSVVICIGDSFVYADVTELLMCLILVQHYVLNSVHFIGALLCWIRSPVVIILSE